MADMTHSGSFDLSDLKLLALGLLDDGEYRMAAKNRRFPSVGLTWTACGLDCTAHLLDRRTRLRHHADGLEWHDRSATGSDRALSQRRRCGGLGEIRETAWLIVAVRAGGHNVAGYAVCDGGLMIDMSSMNGVRLSPCLDRAIVEGGAMWADVDAATTPFGRATPGGLISATGVAGLTLSGGIGWLRGTHGLSFDNLVAADVVTADGRLIHASERENPDLLWALRGGGGNFGVVVSFEFKLHQSRRSSCSVGPPIPRSAPTRSCPFGATS